MNKNYKGFWAYKNVFNRTCTMHRQKTTKTKSRKQLNLIKKFACVSQLFLYFKQLHKLSQFGTKVYLFGLFIT